MNPYWPYSQPHSLIESNRLFNPSRQKSIEDLEHDRERDYSLKREALQDEYEALTKETE